MGDCFVYTNSTHRLNYLVGDQTYTISHFDRPMYILKYLPRDGRVYLTDKELNVVSFALPLAVVEYQTLVLRGDLDAAARLLPTVPDDQRNRIARFLEGQGHPALALEVSTDPEHRFDLALGVGQLELASDIARQTKADHGWKRLGDAALASWNFRLAEECFLHGRDLGSLLLLGTATCDGPGLRRLAEQARAAGTNNVAFSSLWHVGDVDACIDLLLQTHRTAEAVMLTQTYRPGRAGQVVGRWKEGLERDGKGRVSRLLGMPPGPEGEGDEDLFPEWDRYLQMEKQQQQQSRPTATVDVDVEDDHRG